MAAGKDHSLTLDNLPLMQEAFTECIKDLVEDTDFDVMYEQLINTDIGKERMPCVFVLRADSYRGAHEVRSKRSMQRKSQELYNGINEEKGEYFVRWFNAIMVSLKRTGNENNGKHQEVQEKISTILQDCLDSKSQATTRITMSTKLPKENITLRRQHKSIKIVLIGHSGAGKTEFLNCAIGNKFQTERSLTIGSDIGTLEFTYKDETIMVNLWDTAGQERFDSVSKNFYRSANGALLFVDLDCLKFPYNKKHVMSRTEKIIKTAEECTGVKLPCLLVGTKYDLVDHLSTEVEEMFKRFANTYINGYWIYTSAKDDHNVQEALCQIIGLVMDNLSHHKVVQRNTDTANLRLPDRPLPDNQGQGNCFSHYC